MKTLTRQMSDVKRVEYFRKRVLRNRHGTEMIGVSRVFAGARGALVEVSYCSSGRSSRMTISRRWLDEALAKGTRERITEEQFRASLAEATCPT